MDARAPIDISLLGEVFSQRAARGFPANIGASRYLGRRLENRRAFWIPASAGMTEFFQFSLFAVSAAPAVVKAFRFLPRRCG
ncbi:MAG: hypothetical protein LBI87_14820 [Candidatus Accumulibacter sp.]|jgi:hypothetical protein|nr:hypothetical protein [Accumulibacter sp.]